MSATAEKPTTRTSRATQAPDAPTGADAANPAPVVPDASKLLAGVTQRPQYVLTEGACVPFAAGILARGVHTSQVDADGNPLALLVYEPRGARAQMFPLAGVAHAIASGLLTPAEVSALQAHGA